MVDSTTLLIIKIVFIFAIFALAFGTGMIPIKCKSFKNSTFIMGLANAFSGGVFLSIALIHVLPDVTNSYSEYMAENHDHDQEGDGHGDGDEGHMFPLPYVLVFCGYAFILMVDKVMFDSHALIHHDHGDGHDHAHGHEHKHEKHGHEHNHEHGNEKQHKHDH